MKWALIFVYFFVGVGFALNFDRLTDCGRSEWERLSNAIFGVALWPIPAALRVGETIADPARVLMPMGCARRAWNPNLNQL